MTWRDELYEDVVASLADERQFEVEDFDDIRSWQKLVLLQLQQKKGKKDGDCEQTSDEQVPQ